MHHFDWGNSLENLRRDVIGVIAKKDASFRRNDDVGITFSGDTHDGIHFWSLAIRRQIAGTARWVRGCR